LYLLVGHTTTRANNRRLLGGDPMPTRGTMSNVLRRRRCHFRGRFIGLRGGHTSLTDQRIEITARPFSSHSRQRIRSPKSCTFAVGCYACRDQHRCGQSLCVPADALDQHEVAGAEVRDPRGIEGHHSGLSGRFYANQARTSSSEQGTRTTCPPWSWSTVSSRLSPR
jgi:hypothetical protein